MNYQQTYWRALLQITALGIIGLIALLTTPSIICAEEPSTQKQELTKTETKSTDQEQTDFQKRITNKTHTNSTSESSLGANVITSEDLIQRFIKGILYCIAIAMLLFIVNSHLKNRKDLSGSNPINIISRKPIGNRASLMLVEVDGKKFFLSQNVDSVQLLAPLSDPLTFSDEWNTDSHISQKLINEEATYDRAVHE